jgi:hypothetical protein
MGSIPESTCLQSEGKLCGNVSMVMVIQSGGLGFVVY